MGVNFWLLKINFYLTSQNLYHTLYLYKIYKKNGNVKAYSFPGKGRNSFSFDLSDPALNLPFPIMTAPVTIISINATSLAMVKMSCILVAARTLAIFTKVNMPEKYKKVRIILSENG